MTMNGFVWKYPKTQKLCGLSPLSHDFMAMAIQTWPIEKNTPSSAAAKALLAVDKEASSPAGLRFFKICQRYHCFISDIPMRFP